MNLHVSLPQVQPQPSREFAAPLPPLQKISVPAALSADLAELYLVKGACATSSCTSLPGAPDSSGEALHFVQHCVQYGEVSFAQKQPYAPVLLQAPILKLCVAGLGARKEHRAELSQLKRCDSSPCVC
eukprot:3793074-Rhodomonas_salina.1